MTVEELNTKHRHAWLGSNGVFSNYPEHSKLSIQFAIDCLEELIINGEYSFRATYNKIQKLKKELQ